MVVTEVYYVAKVVEEAKKKVVLKEAQMVKG